MWLSHKYFRLSLPHIQRISSQSNFNESHENHKEINNEHEWREKAGKYLINNFFSTDFLIDIEIRQAPNIFYFF